MRVKPGEELPSDTAALGRRKQNRALQQHDEDNSTLHRLEEGLSGDPVAGVCDSFTAEMPTHDPVPPKEREARTKAVDAFRNGEEPPWGMKYDTGIYALAYYCRMLESRIALYWDDYVVVRDAFHRHEDETREHLGQIKSSQRWLWRLLTASLLCNALLLVRWVFST